MTGNPKHEVETLAAQAAAKLIEAEKLTGARKQQVRDEAAAYAAQSRAAHKAKQGCSWASVEGVPGGRYLVDGRLVDALGIRL